MITHQTRHTRECLLGERAAEAQSPAAEPHQERLRESGFPEKDHSRRDGFRAAVIMNWRNEDRSNAEPKGDNS
jgi:hypothetical protein